MATPTYDIHAPERNPTPFELWQIAQQHRRQTEQIEDEILACDTQRDRDRDLAPVPRTHQPQISPIHWHFSCQVRDVA